MDNVCTSRVGSISAILPACIEESLFCTYTTFKAQFGPFKWCAFVSPPFRWKSRKARTHFPHSARQSSLQDVLLQYFHCVLFIHARVMREIIRVIVSFFRTGKEVAIERRCRCIPFDRENYEGCLEITKRIYIWRNWEVLVETILLTSAFRYRQEVSSKHSTRTYRETDFSH